MANELTIKYEGKFKNSRLDSLTEEMAYFARSAVDNVKAICSNLAIIEADTLYKEDGFKSLAEYAETIGLDKSLAHKMENAGRLINSQRESVKALALSMDWSKLALLTSEGEDAIEAGIDAGELSGDMTQSAVREWKAARKDKGKGKDKVLKRYNYAGLYIPLSGAQVVIAEESTREDFFENWLHGAAYDKKTAAISVEGKSPVARTLVLDENGNMLIYRESPVVVEKPSKSSKGMSDKQLAREIAKYKELLKRAGIDPDAEDADAGDSKGE